MNRRLTASSAALAMRCLYSWRDGVPVAKDEPNEAMQRGTAIHEAIAAAFMGKHDSQWREQVDRAVDVGARITREAGAGAEVRIEPAFAWTKYAATFLGENIHREYEKHGAHPDAICGSADLLVIAGKVGWLADWKSGTVELAKYADQLHVLAAIAAYVFGLDTVHAIAYGVDTGLEERWTLDAFDLEYMADWLNSVSERVAAAVPTPGDHCAWCPARASCPETTKALVAAPSWSLDTPEDVARVWDRLGPIEDAIAAIRRKAREYVEANGPLTLPSGKRLAIVESKGRESIAVKDVPADVAAEFRAKGIIKCGAPTKSLREVK